MFNSSLRRVARTCPHGQLTPLRPSTTPATSHAAITASFTTRTHQRRNSSSKPPIPPNNGAPPIPATSVKQVGAPRSDKRPGAVAKRSGRTKTGDKSDKAETKEKDGQREREDYLNEWTRSLPFVPTTQHLNPKDVYVASFFSTHRPISISGPLPPETSIQDIDKIFAVRPKSQRKSHEVIYTLSNAVQSLDSQIEAQQSQQEEQAMSQRADLIKALTQHNQSAANPADSSVHHLDGQPQQQSQQIRVSGNNVKLVIQQLARQFRPFNPPPAPTAAPEVEFFQPEDTTSSAAASSQATQPLEFEVISETAHATLKSKPHTDAQGQEQPMQSSAANTFFTPSTPYTATRRSARGTLQVADLQRLRDLRRRIPGLERVRMYLISVKRQRRLKMKKHKYKKLQRKTRNLRRRQGKI